tara:strand:- start:1729 stop:2307 length:579 start_codon:yes stop_codon:yes gene_type:complete
LWCGHERAENHPQCSYYRPFDQGKTTLIDGMLLQSGAFSEYKETQDRVMDSMDIEKDRGTTHENNRQHRIGQAWICYDICYRPPEGRTSLLIEPGTAVYEGMIVGEDSRLEDMNVNITKEKKMTNVRAAASDNTIRLTPPRIFSLEQALEFIAVDECIEVTPKTIRLRKTKLAMTDRARESKRIRSESPDHP